MPDPYAVAAAIDQRVRQLDAQGVRGAAIADQLLGHMGELHHIYQTASDALLLDLCRRYPGFERFARLMEDVTAESDARKAAGTHPFADLPSLPAPLGAALMDVLRDGTELERAFQAAVDRARIDQADALTTRVQAWAARMMQVVGQLQAADLPPPTEAVLQEVITAQARRIEALTKA